MHSSNNIQGRNIHDNGHSTNLDETMFDRVRNTYDLERLQQSRAVIVGCGGSRSFIETLARTGLGEIALIDPDESSITNIGTQAATRSDIGHPKVECVKRRLMDINPDIRIQTRHNLFEALSITDLDYLIHQPWQNAHTPKQTLLILCTDNFYAQALGNRVALHFGIPSIAAQMYQNGTGAELSFTIPGVTPACHRCVLESRYRAYLQDNFMNTTTSEGSPAFCADRINASLGTLTLMILHHNSAYPRWQQMLEEVGHRNLIQFDLMPQTPLPIFHRVYKQADQERIFFDNTVWLPQKQDHPDSNGFAICPDCKGTGDLRDAIGTFEKDLYNMRR